MIVTIKNGNNVKKVTEGAFENFYKSMGYKKVIKPAEKPARTFKEAIATANKKSKRK